LWGVFPDAAHLAVRHKVVIAASAL
jgi:hypothetical protein